MKGLDAVLCRCPKRRKAATDAKGVKMRKLTPVAADLRDRMRPGGFRGAIPGGCGVLAFPCLPSETGGTLLLWIDPQFS